MSKHTPGPLVAEFHNRPYGDFWLVRDKSTDNLDVVAEIPMTGDDEYDLERTLPNVKLLTAAPELAEKLVYILREFQSGHLDWHREEIDSVACLLESAGIIGIEV